MGKFKLDENTQVVSQGPVVIEKKEHEKQVDEIIAAASAGPGQTIEQMYDQYSHLLYVVDASSSMSWGCLESDRVDQYNWSPEILQAFRDRMDKLGWEIEEDSLSAADLSDDDGDVDFGDDEDESVVKTQKDFSDDELKSIIVNEDLATEYGINLPANRNFRSRNRTKMDALKDAAKDFVRQRFQKYPTARVGVMKFNEEPRLLCAPGSLEEDVLYAIDGIAANGGTAIKKAIERALNECGRRPSEVNAHHLVLISDGEDGSALDVPELIPKMKALGVVFDFIFMLGAGLKETDSQEAKALRMVCEATGGEYTVVKTEKDFAQKLLAVSSRPMLPPARS